MTNTCAKSSATDHADMKVEIIINKRQIGASAGQALKPLALVLRAGFAALGFAFALASGLALSQSMLGQSLPDPTRPVDVSASPSQAGETPPSGLNTIIHRQNGPSGALINGSYVEQGGKVGAARLEKVGEDAVLLRGPAGPETMQLTPGIRKSSSQVEAKPRQRLRKPRVLTRPAVPAEEAKP